MTTGTRVKRASMSSALHPVNIESIYATLLESILQWKMTYISAYDIYMYIIVYVCMCVYIYIHMYLHLPISFDAYIAEFLWSMRISMIY